MKQYYKVLRHEDSIVNLNEVTNIEKSAVSPMIRFWTGVNQSANWRFKNVEDRDLCFNTIISHIGAVNIESDVKLVNNENPFVDFVICQSGAKIVNLNKVCYVDEVPKTGLRLWFSNNQNILLRVPNSVTRSKIYDTLMDVWAGSLYIDNPLKATGDARALEEK